MKKLYVIPVMLLLFLTIACQKDKNDKKESRMDLVTSGKWKIIGHTVEPGSDYDGDGNIDTDIYALYNECHKDNYFTFKRNGVLEVNSGHSKCDTLGIQAYSLQWAFNNNEKELLIEKDEYLILELTNTSLKIRRDWPQEKTTLTFTK